MADEKFLPFFPLWTFFTFTLPSLVSQQELKQVSELRQKYIKNANILFATYLMQIILRKQNPFILNKVQNDIIQTSYSPLDKL